MEMELTNIQVEEMETIVQECAEEGISRDHAVNLYMDILNARIIEEEENRLELEQENDPAYLAWLNASEHDEDPYGRTLCDPTE
jgi:hypothetical protein